VSEDAAEVGARMSPVASNRLLASWIVAAPRVATTRPRALNSSRREPVRRSQSTLPTTQPSTIDDASNIVVAAVS
jgi:hypothetical protein